MDNKKQFIPHSHVPYGADGSGFYSDNTNGCDLVIQEVLPLALKAIQSSLVKPASVFTIVDYGTADGGTSMPLIYEAVKALREKYGHDIPITVIYEDQPINDFKSVFMRLQGLIPGRRSYLEDFQNVFVMACGTNFYSQCVPSNTVHLGFSSTSMHWLSKKPCDITGALHHTMITDQQEKEKFAKQAEEDWELFLLQRAEELAPGGNLVMAQLIGIDDKGQMSSNTSYTKTQIYYQMCSLWKDLLKEGWISEDEFKGTTFCFYIRTIEEFQKPFMDPDSPVRCKGLELVSIETRTVQCPYRLKWLKEKGDPKAHAKWFIPALRVWSNSTFLSGLSDSRSDQEKADIVDEFFRRYEQLVAQNPEDHGMDFVNAYMTIKKKLTN